VSVFQKDLLPPFSGWKIETAGSYESFELKKQNYKPHIPGDLNLDIAMGP
jgi:hypothetical protein